MADQRIGTYWAFQSLIPGATLRYHPVHQLVSVSDARRQSLAPDLVAALDARDGDQRPVGGA